MSVESSRREALRRDIETAVAQAETLNAASTDYALRDTIHKLAAISMKLLHCIEVLEARVR